MLLQVVQQDPSLADVHQQAATTGMILRLRSKVFGQLLDSLGRDRNLNFGRARVFFITAEINNRCSFECWIEWHSFVLCLFY